MTTTETVLVSAETGGDGALDVRPIIPRTSEGLFQRADQVRDQLFEAAKANLAARKLRGNVLRSPLLSEARWVSIEVWKPMASDTFLTERSLAILRIRPRAYYRFDMEYRLEMESCGKKVTIPEMHRFGEDNIEAVVSYFLGERSRPSFGWLRMRQKWWQLWRPRNKPMALRRDWLGLLPRLLFFAGIVLLVLGMRRNDPHWIRMKVYAGEDRDAVMAVTNILIGFGVALIPVSLLTRFLLKRRKLVVRTTGKPWAEPRILVSVDAWQTVVFGLGRETEEVRRRFIERMVKPLSLNMRCGSEQIWYWGLDGTIEREQIVLTLGRSIVFVHIHRYDNDLFVGWDAHLNRGQWFERDVFRGIDKASRRLAVVREVYTSVQTLTEYDVTDANSLLEWAHAQMVQVVKTMMAEKNIDQELDFKIIRGERSDLMSRAGTQLGTDGKEGHRGMFSRAKAFLKRTG